MTEPGSKVEEVLKKVRIGVMEETSEKQIPWESSSLTGEFYFVSDEGIALKGRQREKTAPKVPSEMMTITVRDEEGNTLERTIPKRESRRKLAVFFFENETGDPDLDWLQYAMSDLLTYSLSQDIFMDPMNGYFFVQANSSSKKLKEAGFPKGVKAPLMLKQSVARLYSYTYFVTGRFERLDNTYRASVSLYETDAASLAATHTFEGSDVFSLVDSMALQLKVDLNVPEDKKKDLPISELMTTSLPALEWYTLGNAALAFDKDWETAAEHFERAIKEEETFAIAFHTLEQTYALLNQPAKRIPVIKALMQQLYRIPERMQFLIKIVYFTVVKQDFEKQLTIAKMWVDLYPDDIQGHQVLSQFYLVRNNIDKSIAELERILELDPGQYSILTTIGSLKQQKGEYDTALEWYEKYAHHFPKNSESYANIGGLYYAMGDFHNAKAYYEKALFIEPEKISILMQIAAADALLGNLERALEQYQIALDACKAPQDRALVYAYYEAWYEDGGQMDMALAYAEKRLAELRQFTPPLVMLEITIDALENYIMAGETDTAFKKIEALKKQLYPPLDRLLSLGYLFIYMTLEDADKIEETVPGVEAMISEFKLELYRPAISFAQGTIHELRGEYEQALRRYDESLASSPNNPSAERHIGRCYRLRREYEKSEKYLLKALKAHPMNAETIYEIARLYLDMGRKKDALEHVTQAMVIWSNADADYKPAQRARELLVELQ